MKFLKKFFVCVATIIILCVSFSQIELKNNPFIFIANADLGEDYNVKVESDEKYYGECGAEGDNVTWTLDTATGVLEIIGEGAMRDYDSGEYFKWSARHLYIEKIVIGEGITHIGDYSFSECFNGAYVKNVSFPKSLRTIGQGAFKGCGLTSVEFPENLEVIGDYSFSSTEISGKIIIPDSVIEIGESAFGGGNLSEIVFGKGVSVIGERTLHPLVIGSSCKFSVPDENEYFSVDEYGVIFNKEKTKLIRCPVGVAVAEYRIPDTVKIISDYAFDSCSKLKSVSIPQGVKKIGDHAFSYCDLNSIDLPESVTYIGESAFYGNRNLDEVILQNSSVFVCDRAFDFTGFSNDNSNWENGFLYINDCLVNTAKEAITSGVLNIREGTKSIASNIVIYNDEITEIILPDSLEIISDNAFYGCRNLEVLELPKSIKYIGDQAFSRCVKLKNINLPEGLKYIGESAFSYCQSIVEIIIPDSVEFLGESAFYCCYDVVNLKIGSGLREIEKGTFAACKSLESIFIPENITVVKHIAFSGCNNVSKIEFTDGITEICTQAFYQNINVKKITIGENVEIIGDHAFGNIHNLEEVFISKSVKEISASAFSEDNKIKKIVVDENNPYFSSDENGVLYNKNKTSIIFFPRGLSVSSFVVPEGVKNIEKGAFLEAKLRSVILPECLETIGAEAFAHSYIKELSIPSSVTNIEADAFYNCRYLTRFIVDDNNEYYSNDEFGVLFNKNKTVLVAYPINIGIEFYNIPQGVKTIGSSSFAFSSLCEFKFPDSLEVVENWAFFHSAIMGDLVLPEGLKEIGEGAFIETFFDKEVYLPETLTVIGRDAFWGSYSLKHIEIPGSVISIGENAFYNCDSLKSVVLKNGTISIGTSAFNNCSALETVTFHDGLMFVGYSAFGGAVSDVYFYGTEQQFRMIYFCGGNDAVFNAKIHYVCSEHKNVIDVQEVKPTCKEAGYTSGKYCSDCEMWISGGEKVPKVSHIFTTYTYNNDATYTSDGTKTAYCDFGCGIISTITAHGTKLPLGKPEKITATQTVNSINLSWLPVEGADGYKIFQRIDGKWKDIGNRTVTTSSIKNLKAGTEYTFAVKAGKIVDGKVIWSDTYTTINTATKAVAPKTITSAQNTTAIRLTWSKCPGATGYRIFYKSGNSWKICLNATTATSHTFTGLKAGSKFTFAVRPYIVTDSGVVWSDYTTYTASTLPAIPKTAVASPSSGKITVKWNAVSGAEAYQLYYKTGNGAYKLYKNYFSVQTVSFSGLKSGTKYTFAVRAAKNTSGGWVFGSFTPVSVTVK